MAISGEIPLDPVTETTSKMMNIPTDAATSLQGHIAVLAAQALF